MHGIDVTAMDDRDWLPERFEEHRLRMRAVAYRMPNSLSEAEDAVQETWLRLHRADPDAIENLSDWLPTVVERVSLNMLRARATRREQPLDGLPDPIIDPADGTDPEHEALLADSVGLAPLVVLETLSPAERLVFALARHARRPIRRHRADPGALTAGHHRPGPTSDRPRDTRPGPGAVREHRERPTLT